MRNTTNPAAECKRQERIKTNSDALRAIDGDLYEAMISADLAMQWWQQLNEARNADRHDGDGIRLDERERRIVGFVLGEAWDRLRKMNAIVDSE